jgi:hypothetical protein
MSEIHNMNNFNYEYYEDNNLDLKMIVSNMSYTEKISYLKTHYLNHGQYERRKCSFKPSKIEDKSKNTSKEINKNVITLIKKFRKNVKKHKEK